MFLNIAAQDTNCLSTFPRPVITADIIMNENIYFCDIQFGNLSMLFQIEWVLSSKLSRLRVSDFIEYDTQEAFRNVTALRERDLLDNNVTEIGYTVSIHFIFISY